MHYRDVVFYGLKPAEKAGDNLQVSLQIKGTSLAVLKEAIEEKFPAEIAKKEEDAPEEAGAMEDEYDEQMQLYFRPAIKENGKPYIRQDR